MSNKLTYLEIAKEDARDALELYNNGSTRNTIYLLQQAYEKATKHFMKKKWCRFSDKDEEDLDDYFNSSYGDDIINEGPMYFIRLMDRSDEIVYIQDESKQEIINTNEYFDYCKQLKTSLTENKKIDEEIDYSKEKNDLIIISIQNLLRCLQNKFEMIIMAYDYDMCHLIVRMNYLDEYCHEKTKRDYYLIDVKNKGSMIDITKPIIIQAYFMYYLYIISRYLGTFNEVRKHQYDQEQNTDFINPLLQCRDLVQFITRIDDRKLGLSEI